jgi:DNA primase
MTAGQAGTSLEEFKARLPLVEIVSRHVRLQRRGREFWGCCPFHQEKSPSFHVVEDRGFYHCFGCGQHGNAIDFIMALEGLAFGEAIQRLSDLTGVPAPRRAGGGAPPVDHRLLAANDAAARWFASRLETAEGGKARAYLTRRGVSAELATQFGLGYAPLDRTALKQALIAEGYTDAQLVEVGLLVRPEDGGPSFARLRDRVTFPIHDQRGRIVGFGGRALGEAKAKYLNTPETVLFRKGELLYNLSKARQAARAEGTAIVAEGYMDVIALARAGFAYAVAPLGTAITETQIGLLWRLADEPIVCLDGDEAGLRAAHRLVERALPLLQPGRSLRFAVLPAGEDPDSLLRRGGRDSLALCLSEARHYLEFLWNRETLGLNWSSPERRAGLDRRFRELAAQIADRDVKRRFLDAIFQRMRRAQGNGPRRGGGRQSLLERRHDASVGPSALGDRLAQPESVVERELLGPILAFPELLDDLEEELAALVFVNAELEVMRERIVAWYCDHGNLDPRGLSDHLSQIGFAGLVEQLSAGGILSWYRRTGLSVREVREGWRARVAQHRRLADRRALREAVADAIVAKREREVNAHRLAVDRLMNRRDPTDAPPDAGRLDDA